MKKIRTTVARLLVVTVAVALGASCTKSPGGKTNRIKAVATTSMITDLVRIPTKP